MLHSMEAAHRPLNCSSSSYLALLKYPILLGAMPGRPDHVAAGSVCKSLWSHLPRAALLMENTCHHCLPLTPIISAWTRERAGLCLSQWHPHQWPHCDGTFQTGHAATLAAATQGWEGQSSPFFIKCIYKHAVHKHFSFLCKWRVIICLWNVFIYLAPG